MIRKPITPEQALIKLESLCAASERCSYEIMQKLRNYGITGSAATEILRSLIKRKFVSDLRFASAFVRDKYRFAKWGRRKIVIALIQKRIDRDTIDKALDEIDQEEYEEILAQVIRIKACGIKEGNSFEGRTKLFRSVAARGYETQLITKYISQKSIWGESGES